MKTAKNNLILFESKLPGIPTSIFAKMTALANKERALNLAQGFPDFSCDQELQELVFKHMKEGKNQYAPMPGVPELREEIAKKIAALYQQNYNPETEITITAGATQALFTAIQAFVHPNDEVIIFTPAYDSYLPAIELAGGKTVFVPMTGPDFSVDWEKIKKLINSNTKMIIINTPHNPTGKVFSKEDLQQLEKIVKNTNILILSDEVYEHIVFDQLKHHSVCTFPHLRERSIIVSSFGKVYHTTGWKIGYCYAPDYLMKEFRKVHQFNVFSVNTPIQYAYAEYLKYSDKYLNLSSFYQQKRDYFLKLISSSRFTYTPSQGTYFQLLQYDKISQTADVEFAEELTRKFKIAAIPVSVFYYKKVSYHYLRFCFAKNEETLEKAAHILCSI